MLSNVLNTKRIHCKLRSQYISRIYKYIYLSPGSALHTHHVHEHDTRQRYTCVYYKNGSVDLGHHTRGHTTQNTQCVLSVWGTVHTPGTETEREIP